MAQQDGEVLEPADPRSMQTPDPRYDVEDVANAQDRQRYPKPDNFEPEATYPEDHGWYGDRRCQAWARTRGRQCKHRAGPGGPTCHEHGGAANNRGRNNGNFKHGGYMETLTAVDATDEAVNVSDRFEALMEDDTLVQLRKEIALTQIEIQVAIKEGDKERQRQLIETKRRLVRDEAKRVRDEGHYITLDQYRDQVQTYIQRILNALPREYWDNVIQAARTAEAPQANQLPSGQ